MRSVFFENVVDLFANIACITARYISAVFQSIAFPDLIREERRERAADRRYLRIKFNESCRQYAKLNRNYNLLLTGNTIE
jgi:hypothetical protein